MLQFIFLKLREVQENVVHVIIQHTTDHKRDGDSRKYMTSALGDKVRQISPMFQFYSKIFFFVFTAFKHSSCISSFVFFLDLIWYCVNHIHGSFRSEFITGNWRVLDKKRVPEPGSYTMNWLHQGKVNASVWMEDCSFECISALLFFYSRLHCYILYFENCIFNSQLHICKSYV